MFRRLIPYLGEYKKYIIYCAFFVLCDVACELAIPYFMAQIVDAGIPAGDIGFIVKTGGAMIGLTLVAILAGVMNARFSSKVSHGFAANLRKNLFDHIQAFSFANIDKFSNASLVTRSTSDVTNLQMTLMMALRMLLKAPIMLFGALFVAITINAKLSLIILAAIILLALGVFFIVRAAEKLFTVSQARLDKLNGNLQENLIAIRVVKAFVREDQERSKFADVNEALMNAAMRAGKCVTKIMPLMMLIVNGSVIGVMWFGGSMVGAGSMGAGELISFISYLMQIMMSVMVFSMIFIMAARANACAKRILEVFDTQPDIENKENIGSKTIEKGKIEFQEVNFRYPDSDDSESENVMTGISFSIEPGEFVGIIGSTGSAKTSLVNLIPRFYDVTGGSVMIDGSDVRDYDIESLRDGIGMVMQKNNLFSGTIRENLLWGKQDATQEEMEDAAKAAQAHDFIMRFPEGYDTHLDQGGVNVSGGQKQRLCIARAMLKNPPILIFDDSTSAVDTATEAKIRDSFYNRFKSSTVIIVAQRISSVMEAGKIIVLDDGKVSGIGTHDELLKSNKIYQEICQSQMEGVIAS